MCPPESAGVAGLSENAPNSQHVNGPFCALGNRGTLEANLEHSYYSVLRLERVEEVEKLQKREQTMGPSQGNTKLSRLQMWGLDSPGLLEEPPPCGSVMTGPWQMVLSFFFLSITSLPLQCYIPPTASSHFHVLLPFFPLSLLIS